MVETDEGGVAGGGGGVCVYTSTYTDLFVVRWYD